MNSKERRDRAYSLLEGVGLEDRIHHKPFELSGGEQQRVAIARALACNPALVLADEPTGNLDSKSGQEVMHILEELNNKGTTLIIITHDMEVASHARRIVSIRDGILFNEGVN